MRTIFDIPPLLAPREDAICLRLILAFAGYVACSPILRDLVALPCRLGGMGITNPMDIAHSQFDASVRVTAPLKELISNGPIIDCLSTRCLLYQSRCSQPPSFCHQS